MTTLRRLVLVAFLSGVLSCLAHEGSPTSRASNGLPPPSTATSALSSAGDGGEQVNGWTQKTPNGSCSAFPTILADRCEVFVGTEYRHADEVVSGDGSEVLKCDESQEICGRTYQCHCEVCDPKADYVGRWFHGRRVNRSGFGTTSTDFLVRYDGGSCRAYVFLEGGCTVSVTESSQVGGCHRQSNSGQSLLCGQSMNVCGQATYCSCDAGYPDLLVPGALPPSPEPCAD